MVSTVKRAVRQRVIARAGGIDLTKLDKVPASLSWPLHREVMAPSARLQASRDEAPVRRHASLLGLEIWLVTGDAESREVLSDTTSYSTDIRPYMGRSGSTTDGDIGGLGFTDPPDHTRLRRLLTPEFTMRRLERLRPTIQAIVDRQVEEVAQALEDGEVVDLVPSFAFPIPFLVICELLGLPDEKRETFASLATARFDVTLGGPGTVGAIGGSREFLLAEAARQRLDPGPGLIGQLIREHGDEITDFELGGLADGVFTGGLETSASMIALGTAHLLDDRDLWKVVANEPERIGPIVDELLRLLSVVQVAFPRFAKQDVVVAGHHIAKGSVVLCSLPAANRDPRTGRGDAMDLDRGAGSHGSPGAHGSHLAFGYGFHRCIGAELARMELTMAYPTLAARFPELRLAQAVEDLPYRPLSIVYGVDSVPVKLG
ncbi:MAG: cytochrome [Marmoricola sp.]|nr:cytochrome [Marmoricola sp.]